MLVNGIQNEEAGIDVEQDIDLDDFEEDVGSVSTNWWFMLAIVNGQDNINFC